MIAYHTEPGSKVVEIKVTGDVTNVDLKATMDRFRADLEDNGKTWILEVIDHFTGIEPAALWTDITVGIPLAQKITRVALVADQRWIRAVTGVGRRFTRAEIKSFEPSQLDEARAWIAA